MADSRRLYQAHDLGLIFNNTPLTGVPTAPTAALGTNSAQIATMAAIANAIANLLDSAPGALDTLNELAAALGDDPNFATTMTNALALKAPLASPNLSGTPTAPHPATEDDSTQIPTTAWVRDTAQAISDAAVTALIGGAPGALNTLDELAAAIADDANYAVTLTNALALKAPLASPALTGVPTAPTAALGTNTTQIATMAAVQAAIANLLDSAPGALDTLNELAAALGDDPNFATTVTNALAGKQPLHANLTALAGLTGAADLVAYFTGAGAMSTMTVTSAARTVLDDTTVAAMLTTLGGIASSLLTTRGDMIRRGASAPERFAKGAQNTLLAMGANDPDWSTLTALFDAVFGSTRGAILYRGASGWEKLDPGTNGHVLTSGGSGADPAYAAPGGGGGGGDVSKRQLALRDMYLAGVAGVMAMDEGIADSFYNTSYIDAANSTNEDTSEAGVVKGTFTYTQQDMQTQNSTFSPGATTVIIDRSIALTAGDVISHIGVNLASSISCTVKIFQRTSTNNYTCVASKTATHPGGGMVDIALDTPYTIPGSGSFHVGCYVASTASGAPRFGSVARATDTGSNLGVGSSTTYSEDSGNVFIMRVQKNPVAQNLDFRTVDFDLDFVPATADVYALVEEIDSLTVNTDIKLYASRAGNASYVEGTEQKMIMAGGYLRLFWAEGIDLSSQGSNDDIRMRLRLLNNKTAKVHAVAVYGRS
jgi:hypothetical protein